MAKTSKKQSYDPEIGVKLIQELIESITESQTLVALKDNTDAIIALESASRSIKKTIIKK